MSDPRKEARLRDAWHELLKLEGQERHIDGCGCVYCQLGIAIENYVAYTDELEANRVYLRQVLDDAMGLLHNHKQDHYATWKEDYKIVCKRYDAVLAKAEEPQHRRDWTFNMTRAEGGGDD